MSKKVKKLLEESTVRQFMKYANIETLSENFLDSMEEDEGLEDEEVDVDMGAEGPEMDIGPEPELGDEVGSEPEIDEEMVQRIVAAVADAIEQETGVSVDVEGGPEPELGDEVGLEPELGDEVGLEPEVEEEPIEMAEADKEEVEEGSGQKYNREEDDLEESEEFDYESVVSEVARRVALRLVKESKK